MKTKLYNIITIGCTTTTVRIEHIIIGTYGTLSLSRNCITWMWCIFFNTAKYSNAVDGSRRGWTVYETARKRILCDWLSTTDLNRTRRWVRSQERYGDGAILTTNNRNNKTIITNTYNNRAWASVPISYAEGMLGIHSRTGSYVKGMHCLRFIIRSVGSVFFFSTASTAQPRADSRNKITRNK